MSSLKVTRERSIDTVWVLSCWYRTLPIHSLVWRTPIPRDSDVFCSLNVIDLRLAPTPFTSYPPSLFTTYGSYQNSSRLRPLSLEHSEYENVIQDHFRRRNFF